MHLSGNHFLCEKASPKERNSTKVYHRRKNGGHLGYIYIKDYCFAIVSMIVHGKGVYYCIPTLIIWNRTSPSGPSEMWKDI